MMSYRTLVTDQTAVERMGKVLARVLEHQKHYNPDTPVGVQHLVIGLSQRQTPVALSRYNRLLVTHAHHFISLCTV
ncbi:hypothetical protein KIPB_014750, partial [Kipferlia bialata]|eukprot:g14750.t1